MGGAGPLGKANISSLERGIYAAYGNQAGLANWEGFGLQLNYKQLYQITDLYHVSGSILYGGNQGGFAMQIQNIGTTGFDQQKFGLAYGRRILKNLSLGVAFDMINIQIDHYGTRQLFTAEIGALSEINQYITIGFHIFSPGKVEIIEEEQISTQMRFGLKYSPSDVVSLLTEVEKFIDTDPNLKFGIEYKPIDLFILRMGTNTAYGNFNFGFGLIRKQFSIDAGFEYHQLLGLSSSVGINYLGINKG
jgi:hypothetical protein